MRLHALHVRGLRAPPGAQGISLRGSYTLLTGPEPSLRGVLDILVALLRPRQALQTVASLRDPASSEQARAVLTFRAGAEVYRTAADPERVRLVLARHEKAENRFVRVATDVAEIERRLAGFGCPGGELLNHLCVVTRPSDRASTTQPSPQGGRAPAPAVSIASTTGAERAPEAELEDLEEEEKRLVKELERHAPLLALGSELESRLQRYRAVRADCDRGLAAIERTRSELTEEQARLARIPSGQRRWLSVAAVLMVAGAIGTYLLEPLLGVLTAVGGVAMLLALLRTRRARRQIGRIDARLAALRVREGTIEQRFEAEAPTVRSLLLALDLDRVEELEEAAARARDLTFRLEEVRFRLEDEQGSDATEGASTPTAQIDPDPADTAPTLVSFPRASTAAQEFEAERLIEQVSEWSDRAASEISDELRTCLPLYLNAVARGLGRDVASDEAGVRALLSPGGTLGLGSEEREAAALAIRLALLERLAPTRRVPLLVGPLDVEGADPTYVARAFARLATVTQVVQLALTPEPWRDFATNVQPID